MHYVCDGIPKLRKIIGLFSAFESEGTAKLWQKLKFFALSFCFSMKEYSRCCTAHLRTLLPQRHSLWRSLKYLLRSEPLNFLGSNLKWQPLMQNYNVIAVMHSDIWFTQLSELNYFLCLHCWTLKRHQKPIYPFAQSGVGTSTCPPNIIRSPSP